MWDAKVEAEGRNERNEKGKRRLSCQPAKDIHKKYPADIIHQWRRTATAMASQSHGNEAEAREAKVRESM
jgi:hypothetical protein